MVEYKRDESPVGVSGVSIPRTIVHSKVILLSLNFVVVVLVATVNVAEPLTAFFGSEADLDLFSLFDINRGLTVVLNVKPMHVLFVLRARLAVYGD